jgi:Fe-S cluster assembly iron-binding protein IscA
MQITNEARDVLKSVLQENNASGIRVYFAGYGWGGPQVGLALDEPESEDIVSTINEIQVAIEPNIEAHAQGLTLEFNKDANGLVLIGNESDCC